MVFADFIALCLALGVIGIGGKFVFTGLKRWGERSAERRVEDDHMRDDLRMALDAHDHRKLEDFMVLWSDKISKETREYVQQRIDELFIETDEKAKANR
jgi:hypothetical protein